MRRRLDRRARTTGRLGVAHGERYALLPREVLESEAYRALPPPAVVVLLALAVQYYGTRNGSLALTWADAPALGVRSQAQLYGCLRILEAADLIHCTRRGLLRGGRQLPNLWALSWRPIDEAAAGVTYDTGTSISPTPTNAWARWKKPADWDEIVRTIRRRAKGTLKIADSPRGETATHPVGSGKGQIPLPPWG